MTVKMDSLNQSRNLMGQKLAGIGLKSKFVVVYRGRHNQLKTDRIRESISLSLLGDGWLW